MALPEVAHYHGAIRSMFTSLTVACSSVDLNLRISFPDKLRR
jgi:hypothetical protein